jgi:hypothetical protein
MHRQSISAIHATTADLTASVAGSRYGPVDVIGLAVVGKPM